MSKLLYINACVRDDSRTAELTKTYLEGFSGEMEEVRLESLPLAPLKRKSLEMQNAFGKTVSGMRAASGVSPLLASVLPGPFAYLF